MALLNFHAGTYAAYEAKRTAHTLVETDLYFITDGPKRLFRGSKPVVENYVLGKTDTAQETMRAGVLYINTLTGKITVFDGEAIQTVTPAHIGAITEETNDELVTAGAVKAYVGKQVPGGFTEAKYMPKDESKNHRLVFTSASGATDVMLPDGLANVQYDPQSGKFTFTKFNGEVVEADTPLEKVLTDASYDPETKHLKLTFNTAGQSTSAEVDMSSLVDTYVVNKTEGSAITVNNTESGIFSVGLKLADASLAQTNEGLKVNISTKAGNALRLEGGETPGLFVAPVDLSGYVQKEDLAGVGTGAEDSGAAGVGVNGTFAGGTNVQTILTDHEAKIKKNATDLTSLTERVGTVEQTATDADSRLKETDKKVATLETQMGTANTQIEELNAKMTDATNALTWQAI